jgi:hypothetical protein
MDPYLEHDDLWPAFHHQLITGLYQVLLPGLVVDRYRARVGQRRYIIEQVLFTSILREEHAEEYIEIRQRGENRLVTLVELVSPSNKTTATGRATYLAKRQEGANVRANLVEIDLVLQGQVMLDYSREGLPDWDYAVTVKRATHPDRFEIYKGTLREKLPRFKLPLAGDDRDTVVDLQTVFTRCFDQGGFGQKINYQRDPVGPLSSEDKKWLDQFLRKQKLR